MIIHQNPHPLHQQKKSRYDIVGFTHNDYKLNDNNVHSFRDPQKYTKSPWKCQWGWKKKEVLFQIKMCFNYSNKLYCLHFHFVWIIHIIFFLSAFSCVHPHFVLCKWLGDTERPEKKRNSLRRWTTRQIHTHRDKINKWCQEIIKLTVFFFFFFVSDVSREFSFSAHPLYIYIQVHFYHAEYIKWWHSHILLSMAEKQKPFHGVSTYTLNYSE